MNLAQINAGTIEQLVVRLHATIARINTVWAREHQADGRHAMPEWHTVPAAEIGGTTFRGQGGQTWTVTDLKAFEYWKHGNAMCLSLRINQSTVGGTPNAVLEVQIPAGFTAAQSAANQVLVQSSGTPVPALLQAVPNGRYLQVMLNTAAAFTSGTLVLYGQLQFRTTA